MRIFWLSLVIFFMFSSPLLAVSPEALNAQSLSQNNFAFQMYDALKKEDGNLFFSPLSLYTALALVEKGAAGETRLEFDKLLNFAGQGDMPHELLSATIRQIKTLENEHIRIFLANSLWPAKHYKILSGYQEFLKKYYDADIESLDYQKTSESVAAINDWVEKNSQLKNFLLTVSPATRLLIINAVYFKAPWQASFDAKNTKEAPFYEEGREKGKVSLMAKNAHFNYGEFSGFKIVELPYVGKSLSLLVLLPTDDKKTDLANLEKQLTAEALANWRAALKPHAVKLTLPKFEISWGRSLVASLKVLGLNLAFTPQADFTQIASNLYVEDVLQKALFKIDEAGSEAQAVTQVGMVATSAPLYPQAVFKANHPFLFLLMENELNNILFMGRFVGS